MVWLASRHCLVACGWCLMTTLLFFFNSRVASLSWFCFQMTLPWHPSSETRSIICSREQTRLCRWSRCQEHRPHTEARSTCVAAITHASVMSWLLRTPSPRLSAHNYQLLEFVGSCCAKKKIIKIKLQLIISNSFQYFTNIPLTGLPHDDSKMCPFRSNLHNLEPSGPFGSISSFFWLTVSLHNIPPTPHLEERNRAASFC